MSVSLLEVIEAAGYDLSTYDDANWLLATEDEYRRLISDAEDTIEQYNTCDKCGRTARVDDLIWLTADDFELSPGEKLSSEAEGYDAVCAGCFDDLVEEGDDE